MAKEINQNNNERVVERKNVNYDDYTMHIQTSACEVPQNQKVKTTSEIADLFKNKR